MFNHVLVGVDEESRADHAVRTGLFLSQTFEAQLELVHAVRFEAQPWSATPDTDWERVKKETMAEARKARLLHLQSEIEHPRFDQQAFEDLLTVEEGPAAQVLARRASDADVIVLGEHKERTLFSLSGTARNLLAACPCPVWVQTEPLRDIETILVPVDMSVQSDLTIETARKLAQLVSARMVVLYAFVPPFYSYFSGGGELGTTPSYVVDDYRRLAQESLDHFVQRLPTNGVETDAVFVDGKPAKVILDYQDKADLIVMGTHGHTGWVRAVLGSVANKVITQAHRPVLAVPHPGRDYHTS